MQKIKIIKFGFVGLINNLVNFLIVLLSNKIYGLNSFISGALGFGGGAIISFILNSKYTFEYKRNQKKLLFFSIQLFILLCFSLLILLFDSILQSIVISWILSVTIF